MKLIGDVPERYKAMALNLEEMEYRINRNPKITKQILAKCYTCLAHDWLQLDMEEETTRLLEKAAKISPDYFTTTIKTHAELDKDFKKITQNLSALLLMLANNKIKDQIE